MKERGQAHLPDREMISVELRIGDWKSFETGLIELVD